jgi:hypothetical protein
MYPGYRGITMKKSIILIILLVLLIGFSTAQNATEEVVPAPEIAESSSSSAISWIWAFVFIIIGTLVVLPWLSDTAYNVMIRKRLLEDIKGCENREEKLKYYDRLLESFAERRGMSRFSLMISVTLIIGAVVLFLVINDPESELLKNTIGVLTGALASIIGFYFGGRSGGGEKPPEGEKEAEREKKEAEGEKKEAEGAKPEDSEKQP